MRWPVTIVVMLLVLAVSLGLYRLESQVQHLERQLSTATTQLKDNQRNSRILAAELSYLSQPSRLQDLALRHLDLAPLSPAQISDLASLPLKVVVRSAANSVANSVGAAKGNKDQGAARLDQPPVPGWKPIKPTRPIKSRRGERIVLASSGDEP
ncbi:MAG: hypothetical protein HOK21_21405 [Rhodospirillaceae bacterium]|jgi:hypothetical protein|nr:hypothetical protein [Rhodospirillaceae bacterium]MBT4045329.1 hypothetical protein [Rhodospirillaceae bacterium]MBT4690548.1 hypothetical protein [Rhodospirillaceae bacterium]MBT5083891.1 hypothetical protein [Rhodospirillaceae bacterium]MBT5526651.1 hypothetical protein [Rhodospirillaceae bacterium]